MLLAACTHALYSAKYFDALYQQNNVNITSQRIINISHVTLYAYSLLKYVSNILSSIVYLFCIDIHTFFNTTDSSFENTWGMPHCRFHPQNSCRTRFFANICITEIQVHEILFCQKMSFKCGFTQFWKLTSLSNFAHKYILYNIFNLFLVLNCLLNDT